MANRKDISGNIYGRLTVIEFSHKSKTSLAFYKCYCTCGNYTIVNIGSLNRGTTKSCGCFRREDRSRAATTHGQSKTVEFKSWVAMVNRCSNPLNKKYTNYGGRGITVCDSWKESFLNFYMDMGPRPSPKHSIERVDNNLGYGPSNCRWATSKEQQRNKRSNCILTHNGKSLTCIEWADITGINAITIISRIRRGWSINKSLTTKINYDKRNRRAKLTIN